MIRLLILAVFLYPAGASHAAELPFRTDGGEDKLPWFQLKPGEFPPEGSAHYIAGELIALDHVNRTGVLRPDRTDAQRRGDWDLPLEFVLLPYGSINYHGAPAELRDIPIGTHLHGQFYADEQKPKDPKAPKDKRVALEAAFSRVLKLEDDFTFFKRQQRAWRVDGVQLDLGTLTVTPVGPGLPQTPVKPTNFQVGPYTRVWKGKSVGTLADVAVGQSVLANLTVCTLKSPGRCTNIWLDAESQEVATAHQLEVHRQFQREHGLAGMIDAVDNQQGIVTVTLFAGFDLKLMEDFIANDTVTACVTEENLRTWDQINDRKAGPLLEVIKAPAGPGNSGVRLRFKPALLLEGFRPKRIIRVFPSKWKVDDLPREERMYR
jgi:hypothetical protein